MGYTDVAEFGSRGLVDSIVWGGERSPKDP